MTKMIIDTCTDLRPRSKKKKKKKEKKRLKGISFRSKAVSDTKLI